MRDLFEPGELVAERQWVFALNGESCFSRTETVR